MNQGCYTCKHRGSIPGDAHICCKHPDLGESSNNPLNQIMALLAGVGRVSPQIDIKAVSDKFEIQADAVGIKRGWFNWPWNFDPVWLENCNAYEENK